VLEQMRQRLGVGQVVNGHELDVRIRQRNPQHRASDAPKTVDSYTHCHFATPPYAVASPALPHVTLPPAAIVFSVLVPLHTSLGVVTSTLYRPIPAQRLSDGGQPAHAVVDGRLAQRRVEALPQIAEARVGLR